VGRTRISLFENGHIPLRSKEIEALRHALRELAFERSKALAVFAGDRSEKRVEATQGATEIAT